MIRKYLTTLALCGTVVLAAPVFAQQQPSGQGYSRIQGIDQAPAPAPTFQPREVLINLREEMRLFVQSMARFARKQRPGFAIIARDGLDLLVKRDDIDETKIAPARAYARALDGIVAEGLFYREFPFGRPPTPEIQQHRMKLAKMAKDSGLLVFTIDYTADRAAADRVRAESTKLGYLPIVLPAPSADVFRLPTYPARPPLENASSILRLNQVKNFVFIGNSKPFGSEAQFALKMHDTNFDMAVVEVFHGRKPLSRRAVETLKYKKIGARRLVVANMDVGSATSDAYYWKSNWREGSPSWIAAPQRDDPDRHYVEFWRQGWKRVMSGDNQSYLYGIIAQGFDGVLIDGLNTYRFFEAGGEEQQVLEEEQQQ